MLADLVRLPDTPQRTRLLLDLIGPGQPAATRLAALAMRYDGWDSSTWQAPNPQWPDAGNFQMICTRVCDGQVFDDQFVANWQRMQAAPARWKGIYILPDPRLGWARQLELAVDFYNRAGVPFGAPGHFVSIDDEPTLYHGQMVDNDMRSLRSGLLDHFHVPNELHYVGAYNGNRGFCVDEGWPWWVPWPVGNGDLPSWCAGITAWQWGVAAPGEVPGFPNSNVDVNMIQRADVMDAVAAGDDGMSDTDKDILRGLGVDI